MGFIAYAANRFLKEVASFFIGLFSIPFAILTAPALFLIDTICRWKWEYDITEQNAADRMHEELKSGEWYK